MNRFATGVKKNYYGKGDVSVYRLNRQGGGAAGTGIFAANVLILVYGDAFWPTYTTGDNTGLVATDSMKNFIQRETMNFEDDDLESYCRFIGEKFLKTYPQTEGAQVSATEIPYRNLDGAGMSFCPGGPEKPTARIEIVREGPSLAIAEATSGLVGFKLLRLTGSSFTGFVRDQYTTLPDTADRPLHMWLDLDWTYTDAMAAFSEGATTKKVRELVHDIFEQFTSGSIQQIIYQIGCKVLVEIPSIAEISLEANNRTWDAVVSDGGPMALYTDPRPPYGCLGLTLRR